MEVKVASKPKRMVRKQILLTPEQNRRLKQCAAAAGVPEADIVRQGVDLALETRECGTRDWRDNFRQFLNGSPLDEGFETRVRENKQAQREAWRKRLLGTKRQLAND